MRESYVLFAELILIACISWPLKEAAIAQDRDNTEMIINGTPVPEGRYPWQVRLYESMNDNKGFCGGSLIADRWVLTAAHCALDPSSHQVDNKIVVGYGSTDRTKTAKIESEKVVVHPEYLQGGKADLALIKLKRPITNANWIGVADTDIDRDLLEPGALVTVSGWGAMWDSNDDAVMELVSQLTSQSSRKELENKLNFPIKLHEVNITVVDSQSCRKTYESEGETIADTEICAFQPGTRNDSCYGDSGGPLVVPANNSKGYIQVGIVSWGKECGDKKFPGVYTRVSSFNDWIRSKLGSE